MWIETVHVCVCEGERKGGREGERANERVRERGMNVSVVKG